jgi:predicted RNA-binding Zn-ribbon protein involved in translation (DUF1610 family)
MEITVTLGGDPEFELIAKGRVVAAERFLSGAIVPLPWGAIGEDGSGDPIELRPEPSPDPETLVGNVGRLLLSVPRVLGGFPSTTCEQYPLGGHVHIGGVPSEDQEELVKVIDGLLGDLFYSLSAELRLSRGYGRRGDWRPQPWGVEYRTPPANVWSHPGVALAFLRAIKWVAERVLLGEEPLKDPAWLLLRAEAEKAAEFVRAWGGRLHWGAWKAYIGEVDLREGLKVEVSLGAGMECDEALEGDLRAMCARLGIPFVKILPLRYWRGDYASNVPGYGELAGGFDPYAPGGELGLSWRFRNDPEFRREEMGKLEAAIARILEEFDAEEGDGGRLVKEVISFSAEWRPGGETGAEEFGKEKPSQGPEPCDDEYVYCEACGIKVHADDARFTDMGVAYCEDCYVEAYTSCEECGREVAWEEAERHDDLYYCPSCYDELFISCERCGAEVLEEEAFHLEDGTPLCEECFFLERDLCSNCGEVVLKESAPRTEGGFYCETCYGRLFAREGVGVGAEA